MLYPHGRKNKNDGARGGKRDPGKILFFRGKNIATGPDLNKAIEQNISDLAKKWDLGIAASEKNLIDDDSPKTPTKSPSGTSKPSNSFNSKIHLISNSHLKRN